MTRGNLDDDLADRARLVADDSAWRPPHARVDRRHFRWQVLVECLCGVHGYSFADLIDDSVTEGSAPDQLRRWLATSPPG